MEMTRIVILLDKDERRALDRLALNELRDPRLQVRYLVRTELERRGLLQASPAEDSNQSETISRGTINAATA
jgi:hypothetical protein